ncbi:MAG: hypothetical protein WAM60_00805 [Candidatus Promineifilaceae bacterium]
MDIPLNAEVFCTDGRVGRSTNVILNPITEVITDLVVQLKERPHTEYIISKKLVSDTTPASIQLNCTSQEVEAAQPFLEAEFVKVQVPQYPAAYAWPAARAETMMGTVYHHHIPADEMAVRQGAHVKARDGEVGQVDEFLTNSDGHITHLVMRTGHLWGTKDIAIPVSAVSHFGKRAVELDLNKKQIEELPEVAIHH